MKINPKNTNNMIRSIANKMLRHRFSDNMSWQKKLQKIFPTKRSWKTHYIFIGQFFSSFLWGFSSFQLYVWKGNFDSRIKFFRIFFFIFLESNLLRGKFQENMMEIFFFLSFQKKVPKIWKSGKMLVGFGENSQ